MNELAAEIAFARYGLNQRFQAVHDRAGKDDGDLFLSARDAYIRYIRNSLILEKILDEGLLSKLIPSEDLPSEERPDLFFMTNDEVADEIKKEFATICKVHDILTKGLGETLSFAIPHNASNADTAYLHNSISAQSGQPALRQDISKNNKPNIQHITVVKETNRTNRFIIINKDYPEAIEVKGLNFSKHVKALSDAILSKTDTLETDDFLRCMNFLNTHSGCRIYRSRDGKSQKYHLTNIVSIKKAFTGERLELADKIKAEIITHAVYQKRLSNHTSNKQT
ncbi:MAG: hypothetical protein WAV31_05840 [Candidatus Moraniibacteriota bacterium]